MAGMAFSLQLGCELGAAGAYRRLIVGDVNVDAAAVGREAVTVEEEAPGVRSFLPIHTFQREPASVPLNDVTPYSSMPTAIQSGWPVEMEKA
jgi:hypothetical protein